MSIETAPSGKYRVRYRDPYGRSRKKDFTRKTDARAFERTVKTDMMRGVWVDPRLARTRFADFAKQVKASTVHLRPGTRAGYDALLRLHVLPRFGHLALGSIQRVDVLAWMAELKRAGMGPGGIVNAHGALNRVLAEAERSRMIAVNPAARVPLPKSKREEMRFVTPVQLNQLADVIEPRYRALVLTAGWTGLRWGELAALRVHRLNLLRGVVDVRESLSEIRGHVYTLATKTGGPRTVPLPRFLCDVLAEHIKRYPGKDGYVFTSPGGGVLRRNVYTRHFKPAVKRAKLDARLRFHDLRHSAASIAINGGANVKQVQQMLGHSSATVTLDTYSHVFPALAEQLRDRMDEAYQDALSKQDVPYEWPEPDSVVIRGAFGAAESTA